jgi:peptidoglycan L-alanyl-D-glutamate endopeptidase CwlK
MDAGSEKILALVYPELSLRIHDSHDRFVAATGSFYRVVQGLRTYAEQNALFAQGPDVTKARGGYGNHNFGFAVDCVPDVHGDSIYLPDWNTAHPDWHTMEACMKAAGLAWGGDWKNMKGDIDHFQLATIPATPTDADRAAYAAGGLAKVWALYAASQSSTAPGTTEVPQ